MRKTKFSAEDGPAGLPNPKADQPCGAVDGTHDNLLPEPLHYDCPTCRQYIMACLAARVPKPAKVPDKPQPKLFDDLSPVKRTRHRKGLS